jgi:hypothetical protein
MRSMEPSSTTTISNGPRSCTSVCSLSPSTQARSAAASLWPTSSIVMRSGGAARRTCAVKSCVNAVTTAPMT